MLYHLLTKREGVPEPISRKRYIEESPFQTHVVDISSWAKNRRKEKTEKDTIAHNARATTLSVDLDPDVEPENADLGEDQSEADLAAENEE